MSGAGGGDHAAVDSAVSTGQSAEPQADESPAEEIKSPAEQVKQVKQAKSRSPQVDAKPAPAPRPANGGNTPAPAGSDATGSFSASPSPTPEPEPGSSGGDSAGGRVDGGAASATGTDEPGGRQD